MQSNPWIIIAGYEGTLLFDIYVTENRKFSGLYLAFLRKMQIYDLSPSESPGKAEFSSFRTNLSATSKIAILEDRKEE